MKIAIMGIGYVGLAMAAELSNQHLLEVEGTRNIKKYPSEALEYKLLPLPEFKTVKLNSFKPTQSRKQRKGIIRGGNFKNK